MNELQQVLEGTRRFYVGHGDSRELLKLLPDNSIDCVITDPPAGIGFMGKAFDSDRGGRDKWISWLTEILAECYRVTKPGGRMFCWSIPRTMHWTGMAIENADWHVENVLAHINGAGFPKGKTQLKPSFEGWWLARKPAKHVLPLNIDECRVAMTPADARKSARPGHAERPTASDGVTGWKAECMHSEQHANGRWPAPDF